MWSKKCVLTFPLHTLLEPVAVPTPLKLTMDLMLTLLTVLAIMKLVPLRVTPLMFLLREMVVAV